MRASRGFSAIVDNLVGHKPILIALIVVIVLAFGGLFDFAANNGKAYGGVSVAGLDVGGLTKEDIEKKLVQTFGARLDKSEITLKGVLSGALTPEASEPAENPNGEEATEESSDGEFDDTAEEADAPLEWKANKISTGASLSFDAAAQAAVDIGRDDGGVLGRIGLFFGGRDVPLDVEFDEKSLDSLLLEVDKAIGDIREDATVVVEDGKAHAMEGHDGTMVDREWVEDELSKRMISEDQNVSTLEVSATDAPSRVTFEEAEFAAEEVNRAIENGATFSYKTSSWTASPSEIGSWVTAKTEGEAPDYSIALGIDEDAATDALTENLDATVTADSIKVSFEKSGDDIIVHTEGSTPIPDIPTAVLGLQDQLFGEQGRGVTGNGTVAVDVQESDAPESLSFTQAVDLGIVSVLAEYTTEYSNEESAQNRNHNIHLVSDVLTNSIIDSDGGVWSFNETSGDTNLDPPYSSAGSIVGGEYVDSIGGGICQVATTIFNAAYEAGLDIPLRFNHTFYLANYPDGRDASVSYPDLDLQISNQLESDVLLTLSYTDTSVTATIYGVATGFEVTTEPGLWEEGEKYKTTFEHDDTLADGMYYLKKYGSDGAKYSVTRTVKDAEGNLVSVKTFASVYQPQNEVYVVGNNVETQNLERDTSEITSLDSGSLYGTDTASTDATGLYWQDDLYGGNDYSYGTGTAGDLYGTTTDYGWGTDYGDTTQF